MSTEKLFFRWFPPSQKCNSQLSIQPILMASQPSRPGAPPLSLERRGPEGFIRDTYVLDIWHMQITTSPDTGIPRIYVHPTVHQFTNQTSSPNHSDTPTSLICRRQESSMSFSSISCFRSSCSLSCLGIASRGILPSKRILVTMAWIQQN